MPGPHNPGQILNIFRHSYSDTGEGGESLDREPLGVP